MSFKHLYDNLHRSFLTSGSSHLIIVRIYVYSLLNKCIVECIIFYRNIDTIVISNDMMNYIYNYVQNNEFKINNIIINSK